jgi:hypothetical protein
MTKVTATALVAAGLGLLASPAFAQAPAGGLQRCINAGNSRAYCEDRGRKLNAGLIKPDANFGRGPAPGTRKRSQQQR